MSGQDLIAHMARFAGALREAGIPVSLTDEIDATRALSLVDLLDREEVRRALRIALRIRRPDWTAWDELFRRWWSAEEPETSPPPVTTPVPLGSVPAPLLLRAAQITDAAESPSPEGNGHRPGYSREILLRRKPLDHCSEADLAAMEKLLVRLASRLATRRSRRLVPTRGRGLMDPRRSFRRALATQGEMLFLARRAHRIEQPRLVFLCDTSGSMDAHMRFLLAFAVALRRVARSTEVFAFNTSLTRLTPWLKLGRLRLLGERLKTAVPDWSGGTRIGESLADFAARYLRQLVDSRTVVVILSDGLDRGDPGLLVGALRAIHARARKLIWMNPLLGDSRYQPTARGMQAALPFLDLFVPAHDLASLERLLSLAAV